MAGSQAGSIFDDSRSVGEQSEPDRNLSIELISTPQQDQLNNITGMESPLREFSPSQSDHSGLSYDGHGDLASVELASYEDQQIVETSNPLHIHHEINGQLPFDTTRGTQRSMNAHAAVDFSSIDEDHHGLWTPPFPNTTFIGADGMVAGAPQLFLPVHQRDSHSLVHHLSPTTLNQVITSIESDDDDDGESFGAQSSYHPSDGHSRNSAEIKVQTESPQRLDNYDSAIGVGYSIHPTGTYLLQYQPSDSEDDEENDDDDEEDGEYEEDDQVGQNYGYTTGHQRNLRFRSTKDVQKFLRGQRVVPVGDATFPQSEAEDVQYIHTILDAMCDMSKASDNEKMCQMWLKMKVRYLDIEVAAWTILKRCKDRHCQDKPLVAGNKTTQSFEKFGQRIDALCKTLRQQKTSCRHLLTPVYIDQLVDDPCKAAHRISNNRKVNHGKKAAIDAGREALKLRGRNRPGKVQEESQENSDFMSAMEETDELMRDYMEPREASPKKASSTIKRKASDEVRRKSEPKKRASSRSMYPLQELGGGKYLVRQQSPSKASKKAATGFTSMPGLTLASGSSTRFVGTWADAESPYPADYHRAGPNFFEQSSSHQSPYAPLRSLPGVPSRASDNQIGEFATPQRPVNPPPSTSGLSTGSSAAKKRKNSRKDK